MSAAAPGPRPGPLLPPRDGETAGLALRCTGPCFGGDFAAGLLREGGESAPADAFAGGRPRRAPELGPPVPALPGGRPRLAPELPRVSRGSGGLRAMVRG
jgi:hypothetical protein